MDDLDEEVERLQRGRRTRPLVHDHLRKVHVIITRAVVAGPAVPPHVASEGLPRREAQPTRAARVDRRGLGPAVALRRRRLPPEVARPVAAERLERREPPPARPAVEQLPPAPATTLIAARRRRRACGCRCCFVV